VLKADVGKFHVTARYLTRSGAHRVLDAIEVGVKSGRLLGVSANVWAPPEMADTPGHPWFVTALSEDKVVIERAERVLLTTKNSQFLAKADVDPRVLSAMREKRWTAIRVNKGRPFQQRADAPHEDAVIMSDGSIR
jgi:hypothetical protein